MEDQVKKASTQVTPIEIADHTHHAHTRKLIKESSEYLTSNVAASDTRNQT